MNKQKGKLLTILGAVLVLSALFLFAMNYFEDVSAGQQSAERLNDLIAAMDAAPGAEGTDDALQQMDLSTHEMTETVVDGKAYIGYLTIPKLQLELPILSEWSYPNLQLAPCRYTGAISTGDLVLLAHNYSRHFGRITELKSGDEILFTDAEGRASISFDKAGSYVISAESEGEVLVPPALVVTVKEEAPATGIESVCVWMAVFALCVLGLAMTAKKHNEN